MTATKKQRNANLDLLRIVSMLLIVFLHSIDHSGVLENAENCGSAMYFYVRFTYALCQVCVNIYIMLSGYFMVTSRFRLQKLVTLWMEAAFYSFTLKLLFMVTGLDKRQHALLNLCLFGLMSVWVSLHPAIAGMNSGGGWGLAWFVTLYITSAWLRLYYSPNGKPLGWLAGFAVIPAGMAVLTSLPSADILPGIVSVIAEHWYRYDSAPVYVMTMCLFIGFLNINITSPRLTRMIVRVAPLTLGVYLIHAHANVSPWSWEVLALPEKMGSDLFLLIQLGAVFGIFAVCAAIDAARSATVGRLERCSGLTRMCSTAENWLATKWSALP